MSTTTTETSELIQVTADDGCALAVHRLRAGSTDAAPLLLVHALAMDGLMWRDLVEFMLPGPAVYAVDCRGHGRSGKPAGPYLTARFAQDLAQVLDALGAPKAHLVGCSMGGTIALSFAGTYPQRLASLTVIDSTACYGADAPPAWEARAQKALTGGLESLLQFQVERWFSPAYAQSHPAQVEALIATFKRNSVPAYVETCRMLGSADERAGLASYRGPCAVIVGAEDYATPVAMSQEIAGLIPGALLTVLPDVRHYTPVEAPQAVAKCIAQVMARA